MIRSVTARSDSRSGGVSGMSSKRRGLPNRTSMRLGFGTLAPAGMASNVPMSAAGMTATRDARAIRAAPVRPRYILPSGERVPSGKMPTSFPSFRARIATSRAATESGPPRCTGIVPAPLKNHRVFQLRKYSALARNTTCRWGTTRGSKTVSSGETWFAAMRAGPSTGTFSGPTALGRNRACSSGPRKTNFINQ